MAGLYSCMWNRCGKRPSRCLRTSSAICWASGELVSGYSTRAMPTRYPSDPYYRPAMDMVIPDDFPPTYASLDQPDLVRLRPYGAVKLHTTRAAERSELFERIEPADVLINVRAYTALDDEALAHAPRLRLVSILGTGTDNVDLTAATRRGITVTNTPGVGAPSVAELTIGLMLALVRAIPLSDARVRQGTWQHVEGPELAGKTLGLVGLGAIGGYVAGLARPLGMHVIGG